MSMTTSRKSWSMHPVQAAPRQSTSAPASRAARNDAPRAGSVKRNNNVPPDGSLTTGRHLFTFHPLRMRMVRAYFFVIMYNPAPIFLTNPAWQSKIFPTEPMLSVTGRPRGYAWCGVSPWELPLSPGRQCVARFRLLSYKKLPLFLIIAKVVFAGLGRLYGACATHLFCASMRGGKRCPNEL